MTQAKHLLSRTLWTTLLTLGTVAGAGNLLRAEDVDGPSVVDDGPVPARPDEPAENQTSRAKTNENQKSADETSPSDKPADPAEIDALIKQLGDGDFKAREKAENRLKRIGEPALEALKKAKGSEDPEVVTRASALIENITHKTTLFQRPRTNNGGAIGQRVHVTVFNEVRTTEVFDGDLTIRIVDSPRGIEMSITGIEAGKTVTDRVQAASAKELQQKNPEAYRTYARWAGTGGNNIPPGIIPPGIFPPGVFPPGLQPPGMPGPIMIRPGQVQLAPEQLGDDLRALRQKLDDQMTTAALPEETQAKVVDKLNELIDLQLRGASRLGVAADEKEIRAYNDKCDELRKLLADLKLPDPGDALPPPARSRLGVSLGGETVTGVLITRVLPNSRGEKIGLKEKDVITHVNGKRIQTARDIRKVLTETDKPGIIEVMRDGKETRLEEKPAAAVKE